jgi:hypothetical protein
MAKYEVRIYENIYHTVEVEADSRDEAYDKAREIISNGNDGDYETEAEGFTGDYSIEEV